jgi:hypothetical protein
MDVPQAEPVLMNAALAASGPRKRAPVVDKELKEVVAAAARAAGGCFTEKMAAQLRREHEGLKQTTTITFRSWVQKDKNGKPQSTGNPVGPPRLLDEETLNRLFLALEGIRSQGRKVTSRTLVSVAKVEVMSRNGGRDALLLAENGGTMVFTRSWARHVLTQRAWKPLAKTTSRLVELGAVIDAGVLFYRLLRDSGVLPKNLYNMDEFFMLLDQEIAKWTWHRAALRDNVALKEDKVGFTCSVTTSADGAFRFAQMIWEGKTARSHALVKSEHMSPLIVQHHNPNSHFQIRETFKEWMERFLVQAVRRRGNTDDVIVLVLDRAKQHTYVGMDDDLAAAKCRIVLIPPAMTHVFQPADQLIIPTVRENIVKHSERYLECMMLKMGYSDAVKKMFACSTAALRARKYIFLAKAIRDLPERIIVRSWMNAGIYQFGLGLRMDEPSLYARMREMRNNNEPATIDLDDEAINLDAPVSDDEEEPKLTVDEVRRQAGITLDEYEEALLADYQDVSDDDVAELLPVEPNVAAMVNDVVNEVEPPPPAPPAPRPKLGRRPMAPGTTKADVKKREREEAATQRAAQEEEKAAQEAAKKAAEEAKKRQVWARAGYGVKQEAKHE